MANILYPPIVEDSIKVQLSSTGDMVYEVSFSDPANSSNSYKYIRARVIRQETNTSLVNINKYPDQFIYKERNGNTFTFTLNDLSSAMPIGEIIKIQLSYVDAKTLFTVYPSSNYAAWVETATFSEWSTATFYKVVKMTNPSITIGTYEQHSLRPKFFANYSFTPASRENKSKYKFDLYNGDVLVESGKWINNNSIAEDTLDSYRFLNQLENNTQYTVRYQSQTENNFIVEGETPYLALESVKDNFPTNFSLNVEEDYEEGSNHIYFNIANIEGEKQSSYSGNLLLIRTNEMDNFSQWEEIKYINLTNKFGKIEIHQDYTVESGIEYKYYLYQINPETLAFEKGPLHDNQTHCIYLQYAYLYQSGLQLKLKYNNEMSSFKYVVQSSKQNTIGSKYPVFLNNNIVHYAEFPINGLITLHQDENQNFFKIKTDSKGNSGYYFKDELTIPIGKREAIGNGDYIDFNTNLTKENIFIERKFREKVEEFLNDGTPKLYRSPTEGNIAVYLMNVQLSPNATLGRMISEFSCTASEVAAANEESLNKCGIVTIGKPSIVDTSVEVEYLGQDILSFDLTDKQSINFLEYFIDSEIYKQNLKVKSIIIENLSIDTSIIQFNNNQPIIVKNILYFENVDKLINSINIQQGKVAITIIGYAVYKNNTLNRSINYYEQTKFIGQLNSHDYNLSSSIMNIISEQSVSNGASNFYLLDITLSSMSSTENAKFTLTFQDESQLSQEILVTPNHSITYNTPTYLKDIQLISGEAIIDYTIYILIKRGMV